MSIKHVTFDDSASIAGSSITNTYTDLLSMSDDADVLFVFNTTDAAIFLSIPSGSAASKDIRFPAGSSIALDCRTNSKRLAKGIIKVKYVSAASSGEVTVTVCR
jgi:hypothetical protein